MNRLFIMGPYTDEIEQGLREFPVKSLLPIASGFDSDTVYDLDFLRDSQTNSWVCGLTWSGYNYGILVWPYVNVTKQACPALLVSVDNIQYPFGQWQLLTLQQDSEGQIRVIPGWM